MIQETKLPVSQKNSPDFLTKIREDEHTRVTTSIYPLPHGRNLTRCLFLTPYRCKGRSHYGLHLKYQSPIILMIPPSAHRTAQNPSSAYLPLVPLSSLPDTAA